jgi:hypothetical protein
LLDMAVLAHHTSDSNNETLRTRTAYSYLLSCNRVELAPFWLDPSVPLLSGSWMVMVNRPLGTPELVGMLRFVPDVGVEYIVAPFVERRPSTPLSLPKPTEPDIAPVAVVSYLGQV